MRAFYALKNSFYGVISQVMIALIGLVTRYIFLSALGEDYLGLNGLFTNIISVLSLAELGFGTAALYALYKPLAEDNKNQIIALMQLYKKIYHIMFFVVMILGVMIMPLIPYLIKGVQTLDNIYLIYFIFVADSAISYLYAYKRSILFADQKNFIIIKISTICKLCLAVLQILVLIVFKNFILYLLVMVLMHFIENVIISRNVDIQYKYLKSEKKVLELSIKNNLIKNTKALVLHKIGTIAVFSTDNIITSAFIGLSTVGIYSSYTMLLNQVDLLIKSVQEGIKASIGNYSVNETEENKFRIFKQLNLIIYLIYSFCSIAFFCLFNPFITLWLGKDMIFTIDIVFLICLNFYIKGMRNSLLILKETNGIFNEDKWKPILEAICNLGLSIILAQYIGFSGVLIGTILTTLCIPYIIEPHVTFKYVLKRSELQYYKIFIYNFFTFFAIGCITVLICMLIPGQGIFAFIMKCLICLSVPNLMNMIFYCKSKEMKDVIGQLKKLIMKNK